MRALTVLVGGGEIAARRRLTSHLGSEGMRVHEARSLPDLPDLIESSHPDVILLCCSENEESKVIASAIAVQHSGCGAPVILLAAVGSEHLAIAALRAGIVDYLKGPSSLDEVTTSVRHQLVAQRPHPIAGDLLALPVDGTPMVGATAAMRELKTYISQVAASDSNVLITGETGTGKELVAGMIHDGSARRRKPLISINCAAIPDGLLESELFGYERGAFTGAETSKPGQLQLADGGTVFFDEVGDMGAAAQAKILRAIDTKEVSRLGGRGSIPIDVRVLAATNKNLERGLEDGTFRRDLYFRLKVAHIRLPPLRERTDDIPLLLTHYLKALKPRGTRYVHGFTDEALAELSRYQWPGNVRELKNVVQALFITVHARQITADDLPDELRATLSEVIALSGGERELVLAALLSTNWNKSKAAAKLNWSRMTLYRKIAKYELTKSR